jgi:hypothetical protein
MWSHGGADDAQIEAAFAQWHSYSKSVSALGISHCDPCRHWVRLPPVALRGSSRDATRISSGGAVAATGPEVMMPTTGGLALL